MRVARAAGGRRVLSWAAAAVIATLAPAAGGAQPSVTLDLARVTPGSPARVRWAGLPVLVVRRTGADRAAIEAAGVPPGGSDWRAGLLHAARFSPRLPRYLMLDQPALEASPGRSLRPDLLVVVGFSPYDGCALEVGMHVAGAARLTALRNPCGGERYDAAGRVMAGHGQDARWDLYVPPHAYLDDHTLLVGLGEPPRALPEVDTELRVDFRVLSPVARLLEAAGRGRTDIVSATLAFGVAPDVRDAEGTTPLMRAALGGHLDGARVLLDAGAAVDAGNRDGISVLHAAVLGGAPGLVRLVLERGADPDRGCAARVCSGTPLNTALAWIEDAARLEAVVRALLAAGADPGLAYQGRNAFDWALERFHESLIPVLRSARRGRGAAE